MIQILNTTQTERINSIHLVNHTRVLDDVTVRVRVNEPVLVRLCDGVTVLVLVRDGVRVDDFVLLAVCVGDGGLDGV